MGVISACRSPSWLSEIARCRRCAARTGLVPSASARACRFGSRRQVVESNAQTERFSQSARIDKPRGRQTSVVCSSHAELTSLRGVVRPANRSLHTPRTPRMVAGSRGVTVGFRSSPRAEHAEELSTFTLTALMDSEAAGRQVFQRRTPSAITDNRQCSARWQRWSAGVVTGLFHVD